MMENPSVTDEDSLLAVGVAMGVAVSLVAVTSTGATNNGREAEAAMTARGGNGRRQQDRAEAGIGVLLDFTTIVGAGGGRDDVQLNTNDIKKLYCPFYRVVPFLKKISLKSPLICRAKLEEKSFHFVLIL
jgi:hypothetical protein